MLRISLDKQGTICLKSSSTTEQTANPSRDFANHAAPCAVYHPLPAARIILRGKHFPYRHTFAHAPGFLNSELKRPFESSQSLWVGRNMCHSLFFRMRLRCTHSVKDEWAFALH